MIEKKTYKYIIRCYEPFIEEKAKTFMQAISAIKKMKVSGIKYYEVIRIPFRERHPNFQIYFSTIVLVIIWLKRWEYEFAIYDYNTNMCCWLDKEQIR